MEDLLIPDRKIQIINKVKDSKFYGSISSVKDRNDAEKFIEKIREDFSDATHNVNAFRIGNKSNLIEYAADDGEPSGSSGPPVLKAIKGKGLTNTVIVVSRYFGGTKLGIGGLIRAYGDTARMAIKESGKQRLKPLYEIKVEGNYDLVGDIMGQVEAFSGKILNTEYSDDGLTVKFLIKPMKFAGFKEKLVKITSNKVYIKKIGHKYTVAKRD